MLICSSLTFCQICLVFFYFLNSIHYNSILFLPIFMYLFGYLFILKLLVCHYNHKLLFNLSCFFLNFLLFCYYQNIKLVFFIQKHIYIMSNYCFFYEITIQTTIHPFQTLLICLQIIILLLHLQFTNLHNYYSLTYPI